MIGVKYAGKRYVLNYIVDVLDRESLKRLIKDIS
jgi:hypothetical protein